MIAAQDENTVVKVFGVDDANSGAAGALHAVDERQLGAGGELTGIDLGTFWFN
jgi:hypothetical protein